MISESTQPIRLGLGSEIKGVFGDSSFFVYLRTMIGEEASGPLIYVLWQSIKFLDPFPSVILLASKKTIPRSASI